MAVQGVNLGGWLVPEKWLTPSLFRDMEASDLFTLVQSTEGKKRYIYHLNSFITEEDFRWLARHGVTFVRLPIGYWTFETVDGYPVTEQYVTWAMDMAAKYGIKVLIDLHAAPGSQNGEGHSGRQGGADWWTNDSDQQKSLHVLEALAVRYRDHPALWGIELLNEPRLDGRYRVLRRFYRQAYDQLSQILRPGTAVVFHDAFHPLLMNGVIRPKPDCPVIMDMHLYQIGAPFRRSYRSYRWWRDHIYAVMIWQASRIQPVMVGEWSGVVPRKFHDGLTLEERQAMTRDNNARQQSVYDRAVYTAYWNYKAEAEGSWNFRSLVESGQIMVQ